MKRNSSKFLSLLLTLTILMSMIPMAYAEGGEGEGTSSEATNVAKVNSVEYATLAAAIAKAQDNDTVTLLKNITEDVIIDKNITFDLDGKTLTNTGTGKATISVTGGTVKVQNGNVKGGASYYNIEVAKNSSASLTLENITATAGNTGSSMIDNWGTLTINNGDYSGGLNVVKSEEGSSLIINGGKFTLDYSASGYTGVILTYGTTTIADGEFIQSVTSGKWRNPQVLLAGVVEGYPSSVTVTGGTFTNKMSSQKIFHGLGKATSDNFEVSGGTFNKSVPDGFFADGYMLKANADGTYGADGPYAAKINNTGYATLKDALNASTKSSTITLLKDVTVSEQLIIKAKKLDLNGKTLTSTYNMGSASGQGRYALVNEVPLTIRNGTVAVDQARAIGGYADLSLSKLNVTQKLTGGHACVAFCANDAAYKITSSTTIDGAYAVANFANNATITIENSKILGAGNALYHNGTNYGLKLTVKNTTITSKDRCGVYISGSVNAQAAADNQNGAKGYQQASFTNCTISGVNGVEVKYTDLTLDNCKVTATKETASYQQNNNGPAGVGFAVVSTDNAVNADIPKPEGIITIKGAKGSYTGVVGLGALESVKNDYAGFTDDTINISSGTFDRAVMPEYCASGYVPIANSDGTFSVTEHKPVEVWTSYGGTKVNSYATIKEAVENLGENKMILFNSNYTLDEDFTIPTGVYFEVDAGATLTIAQGKTLTVAADAKRLNIRANAQVVNNGTILVCGAPGTSHGYVMIPSDGELTGNALSVPEGKILSKNANSYYAGEALFEITYTDGSTKLSSETIDVNSDTVQVKLLKDVTVGSWTLSQAADDFVLDLGGHTLNGSTTSSYYVLYAGVSMTIKNGTIKYNGTAGKGAICAYGGKTLTIENNATIDGGDGICIMMQNSAPTVILNGTVTTAGEYGLTSNGSANADGNPDTCNIIINNGATIRVPNGIAIYHPTLGTVTINGGEISGHTGVEMCAGHLVVNGGNITSTGKNWDATGSQNAIKDGAAISIINRNYPGGTPTAEITDGAFTAIGDGARAVKAYDYTGDAVADWTDAVNFVNISGGTFSNEVPVEYCASGYVPKDNGDGTYGVIKSTPGSSGSSGSSRFSGDLSYSVSTPGKSGNGIVTVSPKNADKGDSVTVTVKPDAGYVLDNLTVTLKNGNELTLVDKGNGEYTFIMPGGDVDVKATFVKEAETSPFRDVFTNAYYYEAVKWAQEKGITDGIGNDLFGSDLPCTRSQIVTFLWRAAGSPEPKGNSASMTDVVPGSYYEKAVAWAIENGVTNGTGDGKFSPDATCTRAQAVTFLARALNAKATGKAEFSDVPADSYFADAVAWALSNGVTTGIGGGLFAPDSDCTRAQIVTFLFRAYNK